MLETERQTTLDQLTTLCDRLRGNVPAAPLPETSDMLSACTAAARLIEALGFALDEAVSDLQHMGGCPSCLYNRAPNPREDTAICERRLFFPLKGCYVWRGWKDRTHPIPGEEAHRP